MKIMVKNNGKNNVKNYGKNDVKSVLISVVSHVVDLRRVQFVVRVFTATTGHNITSPPGGHSDNAPFTKVKRSFTE